MNEKSAYNEFHPKWYRRPVSTCWWLTRWPYVKFMLREISCIFVAYFVIITLLQIRALGQGPEAYQAFQDSLSTPLMVALSIITLLFVLLHTITWFNLTPKAVAFRVGGKRIPDLLITAPNYVAWVIVSGVIAWIVTGG